MSTHLLIGAKKLLNTFSCSTTFIIDQDFPVQDVEASLPPCTSFSPPHASGKLTEKRGSEAKLRPAPRPTGHVGQALLALLCRAAPVPTAPPVSCEKDELRRKLTLN